MYICLMDLGIHDLTENCCINKPLFYGAIMPWLYTDLHPVDWKEVAFPLVLLKTKWSQVITYFFASKHWVLTITKV